MAYVTVEDETHQETSPVTGIFMRPQEHPAPPGYIGQIADDDPRIAVFLAANNPNI